MTPTDRDLGSLALTVGRALTARGWRLAAAESCTGGWIAKALTDVAGSSQWFEGGIVAYSNAAKIALLGVPGEILAAHGAVSGPVVQAMAEGVRSRFATELAVAVSGIAGPGGGTQDKPVGTVHFAWAVQGGVTAARRIYAGDRETVRRQTVALALERVVELVSAQSQE